MLTQRVWLWGILPRFGDWQARLLSQPRHKGMTDIKPAFTSTVRTMHLSQSSYTSIEETLLFHRTLPCHTMHIVMAVKTYTTQTLMLLWRGSRKVLNCPFGTRNRGERTNILLKGSKGKGAERERVLENILKMICTFLARVNS